LTPHVEFKPGNRRFSRIDRGGGTSTVGGVRAGIFDEIVVVVDTGGADRAVEIGRLLGAKAAKIARTKNLQSSLPSCHLRGKERELRATFVARNASSTCYRRGVATILSVVRQGRNGAGDLAAQS
jgi:hypothetical protein